MSLKKHKEKKWKMPPWKLTYTGLGKHGSFQPIAVISCLACVFVLSFFIIFSLFKVSVELHCI